MKAKKNIKWVVAARALGVYGEESLIRGCTVEAGEPLKIEFFDDPLKAGAQAAEWMRGSATSGPDGPTQKRGISCNEDDPWHFWEIGTYYIRIEPAVATSDKKLLTQYRPPLRKVTKK